MGDDFDPRDFYNEMEEQFEDEMDAMGSAGPEDEPDDPFARYQVSDDLLKQAIEEEAKLGSKEDRIITAAPSDKLGEQLESLRDSLTDRPRQTPAADSNSSSYPAIGFSFMQAPSTPIPIQIQNSYRGTKNKRSSDDVEMFGLDVPESVSESTNNTKRSRTDRETFKVHTRIPDGDFLRVSTDESRVYLKVKPFIEKVPAKTTSGSFLTQRFEYLKSQVLRNQPDRRAEIEAGIARAEAHTIPAAGLPRSTVGKEGSNLWVDTYLPDKYVDLLSDDGVNRHVLHWLKLWDGIVFSKQMRDKAPVEKPKWQSVEDFQRYQKFQEPDYDGRGFPFKKTVLLAGPPGLGKTTLAHVAARHCGYNVVEMNASDDRSASAFADRIENAVRMTAALNQDNRPNCLIIDEIDGAGAPAINVLVKVLTAGTQKEKNTEGKKKKEKRVRRPIICICNDPWVAALRDLRKISSIITFPQTASARLAQRLKTICSMEQLTADMASLLFLCEKTENDIRSSLNTLQFFKGRKAPLSMVQLRGLDVGSKDKQQNLFKFWSTIFTQPRTSHNPLQKSKADQNYSQKRLSDLLQLVTGTGEYERQIEGIHENLLLLKIREAHFPKLVDSLEWFIFFDQTSKHVHQTMTFDLYAYLMYVPLAFHFLFAQVHPPKVTLPSKNRETRQQQQELADVCEMMRREAVPHARLGLSAEYITTLLSTYLTRMLCPAFRPVNVQLYSEKEKQAKEDLLVTMACFDLQFVQHRSVEGLISYQLEPDLYKMTRYTAAAEPKQLPYSIKQMLAREVNLKRIGESAKPVAAVQQQEVDKTKSTAVKKIDYVAQDKVPVNALRKVVGNKDAFNRKGDVYVQKMRTFYKFNEGYSNAVRKPVKMSSFF